MHQRAGSEMVKRLIAERLGLPLKILYNEPDTFLGRASGEVWQDAGEHREPGDMLFPRQSHSLTICLPTSCMLAELFT